MSPRMKTISRTTFAAFEIPNYRLYISGQGLSLIGTWMQMTAQSWLVLTLTHSATTLGLIIALQTLPVLLLCPYGGVIADRVDKRKAMIAMQSLMGIQALILGLLTVFHAVHVWEIGVLALMLGFNNAFENPARQSFMLELVGKQHLRNAVSLNSTIVSASRVIGPGIGGLTIAAVGSGWCFLFNAISFIAVISSLTRMDKSKIAKSKPAVRAKGQLRDGLRYVRSDVSLALPLLMAAAVGCLAFEFQVTLPYMAQHGLHGNSAAFGFMTASMGVGSVIGGLTLATRGRVGTLPMILAALGFGVGMALATIAPDLGFELPALMVLGAFSTTFMSLTNATLQMRAAPEMRGRVMSLWFVSFQGSTPIGGPIVGVVMASYGARAGLGLGAVTCFVVAGLGLLSFRAIEARRAQSAAADAPTSTLVAH